MTKANEHLDRAIVAYNKAYDVPDDWPIRDTDRQAFRAGVAELLRGMKPIAVPDQTGLNAAWDAGYNAALFDLKSIAGLEGEG